jgi:DNA-binding IclR family transcriptional regulator
MPKAPEYPVPALEKGLDIIEALAAEAAPQSLAGLAARLERSSSELFRMLNCLERRGYVARESVSGKYGLSLKLFALSHVHSVTEKLLLAARRPMQALTETFRVSCHLSVLERGKLLVVAQELSPEPVRLSIEVGATFEAAKTASGRLLLAWEKRGAGAENGSYGTNRADRTYGKEGKGRGELEKVFARIRTSGVSVAESETIEGVRDLAVVVGNPEAGVMAALAVTRLQRRGQKADEAALLDGMRAAAAAITDGLGLASAGNGEIAEARESGGAQKRMTEISVSAGSAGGRKASRRADSSKAASSRRSPKRSGHTP